jgi:hypothetical protein
MMISKFVSKALVPALLIGASALSVSSAHAANPTPQSCVFDKYTPTSVVPYSADENLAYGSYSFVRGAQLFVPAREGLTREWLAASVQQSLASSTETTHAKTDDAACPNPNVKNVQVAVTSAGNGFWVTLIGRDERTADMLLKWARNIMAQHAAKTHATAAR